MNRWPILAIFIAALTLSSCSRRQAASSVDSGGAQRVTVVMKDGTRQGGTVVASSPREITIAGDDKITRIIPMDQVRSVEYGETTAAAAARAAAQPEAAAAPPPKKANPMYVAPKGRAAGLPAPAGGSPGVAHETAPVPREPAPAPREPAPAAAPERAYVLPAGTDVSVRTNEAIDSSKATEGQTFESEVTKNVLDGSGDVVIPRGSTAQIVIRSASQGGRIRGASDLVLDLNAVSISGRQYSIETADITQKGKDGIGANKRTAEHVGAGAAIGAIIGAIAGGGKGAAIGAGAGAGAGAVTQIVTKGRSIKVPAESVLTFRLDQPLRVSAAM